MTVKTIALVIFDSKEAEVLIRQTFALAVAFDAHVIGLHPYSPMIFFEGVNSSPIIFANVQDWENEESNKIRDIFEDQARKNDLLAEFRSQETQYGGETFLLSGARGADLVLIGSNGSGTRSPDDQNLAQRFIRDVGRPVLVVPPGAELSGPFKNIVVGWSETSEAARAAHDAMAVAKPGAKFDLTVVVAHASEDRPGLDSREDLAGALDRRGFKVTTTSRLATVDNRGEELLRAAAEADADLLVTGAFGHSQFYNFMIGAVTSHLLTKAKLPVLLSH